MRGMSHYAQTAPLNLCLQTGSKEEIKKSTTHPDHSLRSKQTWHSFDGSPPPPHMNPVTSTTSATKHVKP